MYRRLAQCILANDPLQTNTHVNILNFFYNYFRYIASITVKFHLCLPGANTQTSRHDQVQEQTKRREKRIVLPAGKKYCQFLICHVISRINLIIQLYINWTTRTLANNFNEIYYNLILSETKI